MGHNTVLELSMASGPSIEDILEPSLASGPSIEDILEISVASGPLYYTRAISDEWAIY